MGYKSEKGDARTAPALFARRGVMTEGLPFVCTLCWCGVQARWPEWAWCLPGGVFVAVLVVQKLRSL